MSFDINRWMEAYKKAMISAFGQERIVCIGIQGSYGRGEATDSSDIDVVLILDKVELKDLNTYHNTLERASNRDKICGFVSGRQELQNWEASDLFTFYYDTRVLVGNLDFVLPRLTMEAARRSVLTGACNIYHACSHNYIHESDVEILRALQKALFFVLRIKHFCMTCDFISAKHRLLHLLPEEEQLLLLTDPANFDMLSQSILQWSSKTIAEFSA